eukprot:gene18459-24167_t
MGICSYITPSFELPPDRIHVYPTKSFDAYTVDEILQWLNQTKDSNYVDDDLLMVNAEALGVKRRGYLDWLAKEPERVKASRVDMLNEDKLAPVSLQEEKSKNSNKPKVLFIIEDEEPGLALARDIIEMHGGSLFITKRSNLSMRIGFSIPFEVSSKNVSADKSEIIESRQLDNIQTIISEKPSRYTSAFNSPSNINSHISDYNAIPLNESNDETYKISTQLPLNTNNDVHSSNKVVSITARDEQKQSEFKKCFLIVDDALSNRKILIMSLKKYNIDCDSAENGLIAVEKVKNETNKYSTIFMDYTMPIMNGAESTRLIRDLGYKQLIFGLTGNALNDDVKRMLDAGVDIVLTKPLRPIIL